MPLITGKGLDPALEVESNGSEDFIEEIHNVPCCSQMHFDIIFVLGSKKLC